MPALQPWPRSKWICLLAVEIIIIASVVGIVIYVTSVHNELTLNDRDYIQDINKLNITYKVGIVTQFNKQMVPHLPKFLNNRLTNQTQYSYCKPTAQLNGTKIPSSYNFRNQYSFCLQKIYKQQKCSSSYSIAAISSINDRICAFQKKELVLSVFHPIFCDPLNFKCDGGFAQQTLKFSIEEGLVEQKCYEKIEDYRQDHLNCKKKVIRCRKYKIHSFCYLRQDSIKYDILQNGPVIASIQGSKNFMIYKSGIFQFLPDVDQKIFGEQVVKIIGWDIISGIQCWIIQNSWGEDWGNEGIGAIAMRGAKLNAVLSVQIDKELALNNVIRQQQKQKQVQNQQL